MTNTSVVFPAAALVVSLLTFVTASPSPPIVGAIALALLPWALVAGGVRIPPLVVVLLPIAPVAWLVIEHDDQAALFIVLVGVTWAAAEGHRWTAAAAAAGGSAASIGCELANSNDRMAAGWVIWMTGMLFGWFAGELLCRQKLLTDQLADARRELDLAAVADERKAIAREVHDIVGHSLTVVLLNIAGARRHLAKNPQAAAEALERAEGVSRDSLDTLRTVVGLLSSSADSQTDAPLPNGSDVVPLVEQARQSGLPVQLTVTGDPSTLEPAIGLTLVRILQESLSNASRHAPGQPVSIELVLDEHRVTATVENRLATRRAASAPASDPSAGTGGRIGLGLSNMTERVTAVHGTLDAGRRGEQWVVRGVLPRSLHTPTQTQLTSA